MSQLHRLPLARMFGDRRQNDRRSGQRDHVLSLFEVFTQDERDAWRRIDRRIAIRREDDVRRRIAQQQ